MLDSIRPFFDHSRHQLSVSDLHAPLDVLAFEGEEGLSQLFSYRIEFTSSAGDIAADALLGKPASFSLYAAPDPTPKFSFNPQPVLPLRTLNGVITAFKRLSGSRDEARYEVRLQPRLALLSNGVQYRIYQNLSIPEIVEQVLRLHRFQGYEFHLDLSRTYPDREQIMQYAESDLAFLQRLCADHGIWYCIRFDERIKLDVLEFHDSQRYYQRDFSLPLRPQSGLQSNAQDSVWNLQASHQVVETGVFARSYNPREAWADLDAEVDLTRGAKSTYGEAYHYAEPYTKPGDAFAFDHEHSSDESFFHARLAHERYLNQQTRLSGTSSSAMLLPGQVLKIDGGAPQAFEKGALIVSLTCKAARDSSYEVTFEAIPDADHYSFRPPPPRKPSIAGTVPARVTSTRKNDPYGHIDKEGRYKVQFIFDRDAWPAGQESMWLRLARPYAGDTHGLHLPLLAGTEVAVAFEQGDPDRPYIAHALHDSRNPDHVNLYNYKRNVLRTPANNKLRMDDERGKEHVKLSTEHSGKSQLNLGHLVNAQQEPRGEGFELRTDGWGAIRSGKGVFISADKQTHASGEMLRMDAAIEQLNSALSLARSLRAAAQSAQVKPGDLDSQIQLNAALNSLAKPGVLVHAPEGVGVLSPKSVCLSSSSESVGVMAGRNVDLSASRDLTVVAGDSVSLLAQSAGMQLKAAHGKVELHARDGDLHALASNELKIESTAGRVEISAPEELVLHCGGAYIRIKGGDIELGAPGNIYLKAANVQKSGSASLSTPVTQLPGGYSARYVVKDDSQAPMPFTRYRVTTASGEVFNGATDKDGRTMLVHTLLPDDLKIDFPNSKHWIGFSGPEGMNYEGIKCTATMDDGSVLEGQFGSDNTVRFNSITGSACSQLEVENLEQLKDLPSAALAMVRILGE
ncbi:type VI secretion system Vgr family protein [Pseudomonas sp. QL9]|uniref:type VI secretion system Vgr family protein n=1 Tax=Pseudomonas sp. QL9 TaxID=3242725 RepID=UPI00352AB1F2